jgi:hypothetical protein
MARDLDPWRFKTPDFIFIFPIYLWKWLQTTNKKHCKKLSTYLKVFKKRFMEEEAYEYEDYLKKLHTINAYHKDTKRSLRL